MGGQQGLERARTHPTHTVSQDRGTPWAARLWALGHSGESSHLVRELHGSGLRARAPAARAMRGRALFLRGEPGRQPNPRDGPDDKAHAAAYLPLVGGR